MFGDAVAAADSPAAAAAERVDAPDAAEDFEAETAEARLLCGYCEASQCQARYRRASVHVPFRSWCSECMRTRGASDHCRRRQDTLGICVFLFEYHDLDGVGNFVRAGTKLSFTFLVVKDSIGTAFFAFGVMQKRVVAAHCSVAP